MINVTCDISRDPNLLLVRSNYVKRKILGYGLETMNIRPVKTIEQSFETIKEVFQYSDEYNHTNYYTILTEPIINRELGMRDDSEFKSTAYLSDSDGTCIFNDYIICIYGGSLVGTHYAAIFDLDFESYNIENSIYDDAHTNNIDYKQRIKDDLIRHINSFSISSSTECSICLDSSDYSKIMNTNCNHSFHLSCLTSWVYFSNNHKCPCCREHLSLCKK